MTLCDVITHGATDCSMDKASLTDNILIRNRTNIKQMCIAEFFTYIFM